MLVIFVFLLILQVNFVQAGQSQKVDDIINKADPPSDQKVLDFSEKQYADNTIYSSVFRWHAEPKVNELPHPKTDLFSSCHLSVCPFCLNLIPSSYFPELGSKEIKKCPIADCGKPLPAKQKKVVKTEQDLDFSASIDNDSNRNGVPDDWEKENKVFSADSKAIDDDPDGDHFTTFEEFSLKTNPQDPMSHPAYIDYMTVKNLRRTEIKGLYFRGLASLGVTDPGKMEFNFQHKEPGWRTGRMRPKKLNELFKHEGYVMKIVEVVPDDPVKPGNGTKVYICREGYNEKILCETDKKIYDPVETLVMWNAAYRKTFPCQVGKKFKLGNPKCGEWEYTVVSATNRSAVVADKDGKKYELKEFEDKPIVERQNSVSQDFPDPASEMGTQRNPDFAPMEVRPPAVRKKTGTRGRNR